MGGEALREERRRVLDREGDLTTQILQRSIRSQPVLTGCGESSPGGRTKRSSTPGSLLKAADELAKHVGVKPAWPSAHQPWCGTLTRRGEVRMATRRTFVLSLTSA